MPLESASYINSLNSSYPAGGDERSQGDDHIKLIKAVLKATFPSLSGPVNRTHQQLSAAPYNLATITELVGSKIVTANAFNVGSTSLQTPAPDIAFGWNTSTARLHARIAGATVTGGLLTTSEFSGAAQSQNATGGHARLVGDFEFHWGTATLNTVAGVATTTAVTFPRGFTKAIAAWTQPRNIGDYPSVYVAEPTANGVNMTVVHSASGSLSIKWFAIGFRTG